MFCYKVPKDQSVPSRHFADIIADICIYVAISINCFHIKMNRPKIRIKLVHYNNKLL